MNRSRRSQAGFSLIEILIVLGLLLVLGTVGVTAFRKVQSSANKKAAKVTVESAEQAMELYLTTVGELPDTESGLQALITAPEDETLAAKWDGPYLKDSKIPVDPWGSELRYELVESEDEEGDASFKIWSIGPDKEDGTDDDIANTEDAEDEGA